MQRGLPMEQSKRRTTVRAPSTDRRRPSTVDRSSNASSAAQQVAAIQRQTERLTNGAVAADSGHMRIGTGSPLLRRRAPSVVCWVTSLIAASLPLRLFAQFRMSLLRDVGWLRSPRSVTAIYIHGAFGVAHRQIQILVDLGAKYSFPSQILCVQAQRTCSLRS